MFVDELYSSVATGDGGEVGAPPAPIPVDDVPAVPPNLLFKLAKVADPVVAGS